MSDDPAQDTIQTDSQDNRPEYLKFVAFLAVLLVVVLALALLTPTLFDKVIPSVMGLNGVSYPQSVPITGEKEGAPDSGIGGEPITTESTDALHTVQEGETLSQIAATYGVTVEALAAANNLISPQQIEAGTVLLVPLPE